MLGSALLLLLAAGVFHSMYDRLEAHLQQCRRVGWRAVPVPVGSMLLCVVH
jgi:hypothetical protein